jgi:ubiquinone/menaquinone biosynthesis C-methylase UbiE
MTERRSRHHIEESTYHQYNWSSLNNLARSVLYEKYARHAIDMQGEMTQALQLNGSEAILDTGCADAKWLRSLVNTYGHTGPLDGINDSLNSLVLGQEMTRHIPNIQLRQGDARDLSAFPDDTFDVSSAQHLYYHIDDYEKAMLELKRVTKPGGQLLIATKGDFNQIRIWEALRLIEPELSPPQPGWLHPKAPKSFYKHFDLEDAPQILQRHLGVWPEITFKQEDHLIIPPEGWMDYKQAILSLKDSFTPIPRALDYLNAIDATIKKVFDREIEAKGFFIDYVQQGFYICRNGK